jgi:hypothetical protein
MGPADDVEGAAKASPLFATYGERVDAESAREILGRRVEDAAAEAEAKAQSERRIPVPKAPKAPRAPRRRAPAPSQDGLGDFLTSTTGRQIQREVIRGLFGLLKRRR